jgi:hypothetical protein
LRPSTFHEFLRSEWEDRKGSQLFFYTRISDFFKSNFPTIKIASDVEKDLAIEELGNSGSFAATHIAVKRLSKLDAFTPLQVEELVKIAISNNQVGWIITDLDVHEFYKSLLKQKNTLQADIAHQLEKLVQEGLPGEDEHDTPF